MNFLKTPVAASEELDLKFTTETIKKSAIQGVVVLGGKKIAFQLIQTFSTIVLARILFPETFGVFAIMVFVIEFLATVPGHGFVAAIIQKKGKLLQRDLSTIFWILVAISLIFYILIWLFAPQIADFYRLRVSDVYLTRIMGLAIFLINIKLIASSILERQIRYLPLTIIETSELLITQLVAIVMASFGFGIESLVTGYLVGKSIGTLSFYIFSPFKLIFTFARRSFHKFISFALNYQIYSLANSVSGSIAPLYVGHVVGTAGTGYLTWAGGVGLIPWAFAELIGKVSFPVFSRVGGNKKLLSSSIDQSLNLILMVVTPVAVILLIFAEPITNIIFTYKWLPAVWALRYFVLLGSTVAITTVASSALIAIGHVKFVRNISLISAVSFWILALILIPKIGFVGHPLAWFLGSTLQFFLIVRLKKIIKTDYFTKIFVYILLTVISCLFFINYINRINSLKSLLLTVFGIAAIYFLFVFIFRRDYIFSYYHNIFALIKRK